MAQAGETFFSPQELFRQFNTYPQIIQNTNTLLEKCHIELESTLKHNRQTYTGSKQHDLDLLTKLTREGCRRRYGDNKQARERVEQELKVIREQDFCCYFLITWDMIRYAQLSGYYHVGRGSGANSIVAYCLGITDVEPWN